MVVLAPEADFTDRLAGRAGGGGAGTAAALAARSAGAKVLMAARKLWLSMTSAAIQMTASAM